MNIFKKSILTVLASLLVIGNVYADKIKIGTEGAYPVSYTHLTLPTIRMV